MTGFTDFVTTELPKRPYTEGDGLPGQIMVRSSNPLAVRQMVWADAPAGTSSTKYIASEVLSGHTAVVLNPDGTVRAATSDALGDRFVLGITLNAASIGGEVDVISRGLIEHLGWTFVASGIVVLGLAGLVTQAVPVTAKFLKPLGVALSATKVSIDLQPAIII